MERDLIGIIEPVEELIGIISVSGQPIIVGSETYTGPYEVRPKVEAVSLSTANKHMTDDVNVLAIPYYETSNVYGKTVIIGD